MLELEFELIEEDTIDSIEELKIYKSDDTTLENFRNSMNLLLEDQGDKINEIIRKVNELDKRIEEKK